MQHIIVEGWFHPASGDDRPFKRGFTMKDTQTLEEFNHHFRTKVNKKSQMPEDFKSRLVSKEEWEKLFDY